MTVDQAPVATDTLPEFVTTDLSLASSFIPVELLQSIASLITQIDRSLYGMRSEFDAQTASFHRSDWAAFNPVSSPINSSGHGSEYDFAGWANSI